MAATAVQWATWLYEISYEEVLSHPYHIAIEVVFALVMIYIFRMPVHKARDRSQVDKPTPQEAEELIRNFRSEPFAVPEVEVDYNAPVVERYEGAYCHIDVASVTKVAADEMGNSATTTSSADQDEKASKAAAPSAVAAPKSMGSKKVLNASSFDFLCYATEPSVIEAASDTIVEYGCGSCGPRGFYGSLKPHLDLEADLAKFMGTHSAIIYSFSFATTSTLIPCFSSRGDEILCDEAVNLVIQQGCSLSRSHVKYFRHNDMAHLEELMKESHAMQKRKGKRVPPRRFIVTEGVFRNTGALCNLREIAALKERYKFRLVLDDSFGFGTLGSTGRGTPEHFNVPIDQVEIYVGALSTSLGSVGGFCCGSHMMIDHQRLAATGYVFSAALPPYASVGASSVLKLMVEDPSRIHTLQKHAGHLRTLFESGKVALPKTVAIISPTGAFGEKKKKVSASGDLMAAPTCIVHFTTTVDAPEKWVDVTKKFVAAAEVLLEKDNILVMPALYNAEERVPVRPSLRVSIKSEVPVEEITRLANSIGQRLREVFA